MQMSSDISFFVPSTAHIWNWTAKMPLRLANATTAAIGGEGGFFAFGLEGVLHGAAILSFLFVAFDAMVVGADPSRKHKYIDSFKKTIPASATSVNGLAFVCFLGISVAVTLTQPYFSLVSEKLTSRLSFKTKKTCKFLY